MAEARYEIARPDQIAVGDVIFTMNSDHTVTSVEFRPRYAHPGLKVERPAYLVRFADWKGLRAYRPGATITRRKRAEGAA